ncbi:transposase is4 [Holotrichia oblita]|uniref:Transposase is4 n=1 Tax=Holotrichia oblita TaxID=644536 RepID=A0ACB9SM09_HOLOL|nr:transposase is4 [Holotrichia oblita]
MPRRKLTNRIIGKTPEECMRNGIFAVVKGGLSQKSASTSADSVDIAVLPPDPDILSDCDEGDDDGTGEYEVSDVPGNLEIQLQGPNVASEQGSSGTQKQKASKSSAKNRASKKLTDIPSQWCKSQPSYSNETNIIQTNENKIKKVSEEIYDLSPVQLFEKFFSDDIYNLLQVETERYAKCTKNLKDFTVTSNELRVFVGFLLFSGYHILPSEKLYWSVDEDAGQQIVKEAMSRNTYLKLKSVFHCCDNNDLDLTDR